MDTLSSLLFISMILPGSAIIQSSAVISSFGYHFIPFDPSATPLSTFTRSSLIRCYVECNKLVECRTFDFDEDSKQCRLWSDDSTTGSISLATSSKPRSKVGSIKITSHVYTETHGQSCEKCVESRYETCDTSTGTCQCPILTFWNGSTCMPQRYRNQSCSTLDTCRSDQNLECLDINCNSIYTCRNRSSSSVTVAGLCNATIGNGSQGLSGPWGLYVTSDHTIYISDYDAYRIIAYPSLSRFGTTVLTTANQYIDDFHVDHKKNIYAAVIGASKVLVFPSNITFPKIVSYPCNLSALYAPYGVAVDGQGNIYVSDFSCHMITKWTVNSTNGILIAGQMNTAGSTNQLLHTPKCIFYDENSSALYVVDYDNHRVQKFFVNGNRTGVTVAGGNGLGTGLHQLQYPTGVSVSRKDGSIFVSDTYNHRVMKWKVNATQGSIIAGITGITGTSPQLLDTPGDIALDPSETFLYVADYGNHRVQRFRV